MSVLIGTVTGAVGGGISNAIVGGMVSGGTNDALNQLWSDRKNPGQFNPVEVVGETLLGGAVSSPRRSSTPPAWARPARRSTAAGLASSPPSLTRLSYSLGQSGNPSSRPTTTAERSERTALGTQAEAVASGRRVAARAAHGWPVDPGDPVAQPRSPGRRDRRCRRDRRPPRLRLRPGPPGRHPRCRDHAGRAAAGQRPGPTCGPCTSTRPGSACRRMARRC